MNTIISLADYRPTRTRNDDARAFEHDIKDMLSSMTKLVDALIEADNDEYAQHHNEFKKSLWLECNDLMQQIDLMVLD